jgi:hypothetical protein
MGSLQFIWAFGPFTVYGGGVYGGVYGLVGPLARLRFTGGDCSPGIYPGDYRCLQPVLAFIVRNIYRQGFTVALGFNPGIEGV